MLKLKAIRQRENPDHAADEVALLVMSSSSSMNDSPTDAAVHGMPRESRQQHRAEDDRQSGRSETDRTANLISQPPCHATHSFADTRSVMQRAHRAVN